MNKIVALDSQNMAGAKRLADENREALGFIPRKKFEELMCQERGLVALQEGRVVGFVLYRHRKRDLQTTLSEICVDTAYRRRGIGAKLISALLQDCKQRGRTFIQLKCPVDLSANTFYKRLGFHVYTIEAGKKRHLHVWRLEILTRPIE